MALLVLAAIGAGAWLVLLGSQTTLPGAGVFMAPMMQPAAAGPYLAAATMMWIIMMVAMMTPAAMPMAAVYRHMQRGRHPNVATLSLALGYLLSWALFAVIAAALQWLLHIVGVLHGMTLATGTQAAAGLLIAAGIYQLTPLKAACLMRCRSPLGFFMAHWRAGYAGALVMGLRHGLFCIGCCWVLMLLMFAGGAMSLLTMAALSVMILAERTLPAGPWITKLPGLVLIGLGVVAAIRT